MTSIHFLPFDYFRVEENRVDEDMLVSQSVEIKWNNANKKHYESKGYKYSNNGQSFRVDVNDISKASSFKVKVQCDYCGLVHIKTFRVFKNGRNIIEKDCCKGRQCMVTKSEEISLLKYGVTNYAKRKSSKVKKGSLLSTPISEVVKVSNNKGIKILNINDFKNERTRLRVTCVHHKERGVQDTSYANIKKNKGCCYYGRGQQLSKSRRLNGEFVVDAFIKAGFTPVFESSEYTNNIQKLPYVCNKHPKSGVQSISYANFSEGYRCYHCGLESRSASNRADLLFIEEEFDKKGLVLEDVNQYINRSTELSAKCKYHPTEIQYFKYESLRYTEKPCAYCRYEGTTGLIGKTLRSATASWRIESERDCNHQCVLTGDKDYEVHHLYSYHKIVMDAMDLLGLKNDPDIEGVQAEQVRSKVRELHEFHPLGVCLRSDLHKLFHQIYSKTNNTPEQFYEFRDLYKSGKIELEEKKEVVV